jgi:hypothetical protein
MNISDKFLTALVGSAIAIVQVQLAIALSSQEVGQIAREITVVIAGPDGRGSGVIVDQNNDTYYVLTAYHVIKEPGAYEIHTPDGERYPVFRSQRIGNFDLALIWFTSKNNYQVAQQSQSGEPGLGATVYHAGYPYEWNQPRVYRFFEAKITGISSNTEEGYDLSYDGKSLPGMSGGPLLNEQGHLIGIHGKAETVELPNRIQEIVGTQAIPIEYYQQAGGIAVVNQNNQLQIPPESEPTEVNQPSPPSISENQENNQTSQDTEEIPPQSSPSPQLAQSPQQPIISTGITALIQAQKTYYMQRGYFARWVYNLEVELPSDYDFAIRTTTRAAYQYAIPDSLDQKAYVGATFLDRNATADNPQMVSIICEAIEPGTTRPADPVYRVDGSLICSRGTQEVVGDQ